MIRKGRYYSVEEILPLVEFRNNAPRKELDGDLINFATLRLQCFATHGIVCARCGILGELFFKEKLRRSDKFFHLGFYALDGYKKEIMITIDHVIPKSRGGKNRLSNLQTLCFPCNQDKGDKDWSYKW